MSHNKIVEKVVLSFYLGHGFGIWAVFWILGIVLDSGSVFGFWKVFRILGIVLDSGKLFWIQGSVLSSLRVTVVNPLRFLPGTRVFYFTSC